MNNIVYREIKKEDYNRIKLLINEAFGIHKFIENKDVLDKFLTIYLRSCLSIKNFSSVAVIDDNVVGIILGSSKNKHNIFNSTKHNLVILYNCLSLVFKYKNQRNSLNEYKKISNSYKDLMANREDQFQGCIDLLIVAKECQGLGVGKKLFTNLLEYMKKNDVSNIYVYTDSICNYGFYDSQGFKRLDVRDVEILNSSISTLLNIYLYTYKI